MLFAYANEISVGLTLGERSMRVCAEAGDAAAMPAHINSAAAWFLIPLCSRLSID
jgi:hypothetical protein